MEFPEKKEDPKVSTHKKPIFSFVLYPFIKLRKMVDKVSVRLLLIIFFSAVPIATIAIIFAWNNYRLTFSGSLYRGVVAASRINAAIQNHIAGSRSVMRALSQDNLQKDPAACKRILDFVYSASDGRYRVLQFRYVTGYIVCSTGDTSLLQQAQVQWERKSPVLLIPFSYDKGPHAGYFFIQITRRLFNSEKTFSRKGDGYMTGVITIGGSKKNYDSLLRWRNDDEDMSDTQAWIIYNDRQIVPLCRDCMWSHGQFLNSTILNRLYNGEHSFYMRPSRVSSNEGGAVYSLMQVSPGINLVVRTGQTDVEQHAFAFFVVRVVEIVFFLMVGLGAVAVGGNILVTAPLQRLTEAVQHWKQTKVFDGSVMYNMPLELRQLGFSFMRATRRLTRHEEHLIVVDQKQKLLIREIHHRVKNNLQIIASLLNLQMNRIKNPQSRAEFATARERVKALATLHRYMYGEDSDVQAVNMRHFMEELCCQIIQAFGYDSGDTLVSFQSSVEDITLTIDQAVPLALIVTEILSNSLKYAFVGRKKGTITITLCHGEPGTIKLTIADDGVGFNLERNQEERKGIGMQLIKGFARQIGASLGAVSQKNGTIYTFTIPYPTPGGEKSSGLT
ncbi:sensor histidine kinase [Entomobacter blattae]|uniref:histidine kinase n=1 Tax=Entomobacter blattae TaxID=2762277 RepID=A0A7H1NS30_9PROT|nr:sensor histidine kinase [Entomobacter blattae]QNT78590.1 Histidine kinase [Entomobacter blattae]